MQKIMNYTQYRVVNEKNTEYLHIGTTYYFKITEEDKQSLLKTELSEVGCSVDRRNIYYKFTILKSDNLEKYSLGSELIFPIEFDNKEFGFICNHGSVFPTSGKLLFVEKHYRAHINQISEIEYIKNTIL